MKSEFIDYIGIFRNLDNSDYCKSMIKEFEKLSNKDSSIVSDGELQFGNAMGRKDQSIFFDSTSPDLAEQTNRILDQCLDKYMDEYPGLRNQNFMSQYVKVQKTLPKGGYHVWHAEQGGSNMHDASRCLVWTIYLNNISKKQGETEFLHQGYRLEPEEGMVCLFPASWNHVHRGNFTTTDTKYIATGWYNLI